MQRLSALQGTSFGSPGPKPQFRVWDSGLRPALQVSYRHPSICVDTLMCESGVGFKVYTPAWDPQTSNLMKGQ